MSCFFKACGRCCPNFLNQIFMSIISFSHCWGLISRSSVKYFFGRFKLDVSKLFGVGTNPMGVLWAVVLFSSLSNTHFRTRMFSLNPGHKNFPSRFLRNQLT